MPSLKTSFFIIIILLVLAASAVLVTGYAALNDAETALQQKDYQRATELYIRAARILIWREDLWEEAALAAAQTRDFSSAIYYFQRAKLTERGQYTLAYSYYQVGDLESARQAYEKGAALYHKPAFYAGLAFIFRSEKKWDEERDALENQILLDVENAPAHYRLGVLLSAFEPDLALPELMYAASLDPQFDSAAQTLRSALNISTTPPDESQRMVINGRALGLVEEWELSAIVFDKAIQLDAKNAEAWAWLGEANQHRGQDGRVELDRALNLDGKSSIVRALRGLYWSRQKKYPEALKEYQLAAEHEPQNPAWQASLGDAYFKTGDLVSALSAYQHAAELAPTESKYWRLLAVFCIDNTVNVEEIGLPAAQKAAQIAPNDPLALDALGWAYFSSGRYASAEQTLLDVIARFPEHSPAHIHLAITYLTQGNNTAAFRELIYVRDSDVGGEDGLLAAQLLAQYFP